MSPLPLLVAAAFALGAPGDTPRVPRDLAWGKNGHLFVASREGRGLIEIDPAKRSVTAEYPIGTRLNSLRARTDAPGFVAGGTDGELVVIDEKGRAAITRKLGRGPARVLDLGGGRIFFTSLWDRSAIVADAATGEPIRSIPIGFEPDASSKIAGGRVLVADAFVGRLAMVEPASGSVKPIAFDGAGIGGIGTSADGTGLFISHFTPFGSMPLTRTNVDWGLVLSSKLTVTSVTALEQAGRATPRMRRMALDGSRHGEANPTATALSPDQRLLLIVASGANHLLIHDRELGGRTPEDGLPSLGSSLKMIAVPTGRHPVAVVVDAEGRFAYTADAMDDAVTIVDLIARKASGTIKLGPGYSAGSAELRGEALFTDGRRSIDRWMSCATCHPRAHTASAKFDTLGDGDYGAAKDTPSLLGVGATSPYAWTGRFPDLEAQVDQSFGNSMHGERPTASELSDLVAFLKSNPPPPPLRDASDPKVKAGASLFETRKCSTCHKAPSYAGTGTEDVGLADENDVTQFNPPSLRGVGRSAPYFHDGRAAELRDAVGRHSPLVDKKLTEAEIEELTAFLESL